MTAAPKPITDLDADEVISIVWSLWFTGVQDTMDIAESTGLTEPQVCLILHEGREDAR